MRAFVRPFVFLVVGLLTGWGAATWRHARATSRTEAREAFRREQLAGGGQLVEVRRDSTTQLFVLDRCRVYLVEEREGAMDRTKVLATGFYPLPTACTSQSLSFDGEWFSAELANRAIGAGGGNTTGGSYRSRDGRAWEKLTDTGWVALDAAR